MLLCIGLREAFTGAWKAVCSIVHCLSFTLGSKELYTIYVLSIRERINKIKQIPKIYSMHWAEKTELYVYVMI